MEAQLRRHQNTLMITGAGVIIFALWSMIKTVIVFLYGSDTVQDQAGSSEVIDWDAFMIVVLCLLILFMLIDFALRKTAIVYIQ